MYVQKDCDTDDELDLLLYFCFPGWLTHKSSQSSPSQMSQRFVTRGS